MKKALSILLVVASLLSVMVFAPATASAAMFGDVDGNNKVNVIDALKALRLSVNLDKTTRFDRQAVADVDNDDTTTAVDALLILQYSAELISGFADAGDINKEVYNVKDTPLENDAYVNDDTADTSFVLTTAGLQNNTIYYFTPESGYLAADRKDEAAWEYRNKLRTWYAFQGLLNRDFGRAGHTSLLYMAGDDTDGFWYDYITNPGNSFAGFEKYVIKSIDEFPTIFANQIKQCGFVTWETVVPASANVALTICGVDGYLPVQQGTAIRNQLINAGATEKMSLIGKFTGSVTGSRKNDAYRWALDNYMHRCSSKYVAYTLDGAPDVYGGFWWWGAHSERSSRENHDYIVARRAFAFDLSPIASEVPCDEYSDVQAGYNIKAGTDVATLKLILQRRYERAGGAFGQMLGFPPWWLKYSNQCSLPGISGGSVAPHIGEWTFCEIITCYNMAKEADASAPVSMTNGSVFYKFRPSSSVSYKNNSYASPSYDSSKKYWTIYVGDYDSSAWLKRYMYHFWTNDGARGQFDLSWGFNPNLSYRVPMCFQYMYETKSSYDYFIAGDSGAGYVVPAALETGKTLKNSGMQRPSSYTGGLDKWRAYSKTFYDRLDYKITGFILCAENGLSYNAMNSYSQLSPIGNFHNDTAANRRFNYVNGVPFLNCHGDVSATMDYNALMYDYAYVNHMSPYNFYVVRMVVQSPSTMLNMVNTWTSYVNQKGVSKVPSYTNAYTLLALAKKSGQGTTVTS